MCSAWIALSGYLPDTAMQRVPGLWGNVFNPKDGVQVNSELVTEIIKNTAFLLFWINK